MKIGLHDSDKTGFPNLALMKLSAWHKRQGHEIEWFNPLLGRYDQIFSSKVFTYSQVNPYLPASTMKGGIGYDMADTLPDHVEHIMPDYDLYDLNYSMGFLTRGCIRQCEWCFVPAKEGKLREHADITEFTKHKRVVLLDNNVLAHPHGIAQIEKIINLQLRVDFNQGLDARLIDDKIARLLSKVKWLHPLRLACDSQAMVKYVQKAIEHLRWHNVAPRRYFCYVLIKDIDDALERIRFLKGLNVDPFAQPFMDRTGTKPTLEQRELARWCNHKAEYKSQTWEDYKMRKIEEGDNG